jgi:hypothetical protein
MTKSARRKVSARKVRSNAPKKATKRTAKVAAKMRNNIAAETIRDTRRAIDGQFDRFTEVPETLRVVAGRNIAQAREVYESSKDTLQAVLESWRKSFGAVGQNAFALNRKMIDVSERNINASFDFAADLAQARNFTDILDLQTAYWRKLLGESLRRRSLR